MHINYGEQRIMAKSIFTHVWVVFYWLLHGDINCVPIIRDFN